MASWTRGNSVRCGFTGPSRNGYIKRYYQECGSSQERRFTNCWSTHLATSMANGLHIRTVVADITRDGSALPGEVTRQASYDDSALSIPASSSHHLDYKKLCGIPTVARRSEDSRLSCVRKEVVATNGLYPTPYVLSLIHI